ncbi:tRNA 2-thiouridine(34) synthase MnmA [Candidiatus Paracoxiella cheracis]|uniref:tRNA 2-thiouridine(34) synthase MnmA n=1 Tax=Candidiatus Paracoxiella cheracis TaxID=3405120 RepID=UPI003BF547E8
MKNKVIVGLSGGVDSAVAALTLKQQGYDVSGIFMQNWEADREDPFCTAEQDLSDAKAICDQLGIPLQTANFAKEYWDNVFQYCLDEFAAGRTPNPDIWCNREIKFKAFLDHALALGADFLATGHYARIKKIDRHYCLLKSADANKDQTYFLYTLGQKQLAHSIFPIGELQKSAVRKIAQEANFINYAKKDSTGICFIGERKFKDFLNEFLLAQPGNMETPEGKHVGKHDGVMFYTIGQRKGLNIGGREDANELPWYVLGKDVKRNVLIVGQGDDHPMLYHDHLTCEQVHWISEQSPQFPLHCSAKIRYRQTDQACRVTQQDNNCYEVNFEQPQRAITPGQSVVFYDGDRCLGGGVIRD